MKSKSQRTGSKRQEDSKQIDKPNYPRQSRSGQRSQSKHRSAEKIPFELHSKFKITARPTFRHRIKTEVDETARGLVKPILSTRKKEATGGTVRGLRPQDSVSGRPYLEYSSDEGQKAPKSYRNQKKLHLNPDLFDALKNYSQERYDTPLSGKLHSGKRQPETTTNRSVSRKKKTALERYISESVQNLDHTKKAANTRTALKRTDLMMTENIDKIEQTVAKDKKLPLKILLDDDTSEIKPLAEPPVHRRLIRAENSPIHKEKQGRRRQGQPPNSARCLTNQKQDSVEKIEIKWEKRKKNPFDMTQEEIELFGERFLEGFQKIKLLGRGGFALVWLAQNKKNKKKYAIKQILTSGSQQTHVKEIWFGSYFFGMGGAPKPQFSKSEGIKHLVKFYSFFIDRKDAWLIYEKCGQSLGNCLYELRSEPNSPQRAYRIHYKQLYLRMRADQNEIRRIIHDLAQVLALLTENNIVHSDVKTQNILVRLNSDNSLGAVGSQSLIAQTKLIDYGSSFTFEDLRQFSTATPQYSAPQILNYILYQGEHEYIPILLQYLQQYKNCWVIDVWSLGSVLLQIVSGIPLWMSLKTLIKGKNGADVAKYGLFAIKGRGFDKIIKKQLEVVQNLDFYLNQQNHSGIRLADDLRTLLKKMLTINPNKRISPLGIIEHLKLHGYTPEHSSH